MAGVGSATMPRAPVERLAELVRSAGSVVALTGAGISVPSGLPRRRCRAAACVGSSLEVHPVAGLPELTLRAGGAVALVTRGLTPYDADAAIKLEGDIEAELGALLAALS